VPPERLLITTPVALTEQWPHLGGAAVVGLDVADLVRDLPLDPSTVEVEGAMFLGCRFAPGMVDALTAGGATILSRLGDVPFEVYRSGLYTLDELADNAERGLEHTLDARVTRWFEASSSTSLPDLIARALHDAAIDAAVARFVLGRRVVGVMGGHARRRDDPLFRRAAEVGRGLTRRGFTVATGGGPGLMEAANLGAWCAPFHDDALDESLSVLARSPSYPDDPAGYLLRALEVRRAWPEGGTSLGVPTWVYAHEPTGAFATHIAKYFTNSIREDGLLAIARSGVVYAPGGAGTQQEIFTDAAQNSLDLYEVRSPMVFLDSSFFEVEHPELLAATRRQAETFGWEDLVEVCDDPVDVVDFIAAHDPDGPGSSGVQQRRAHHDMRT
jgi:predicted Rossmann-fold nucleotide-binding protein